MLFTGTQILLDAAVLTVESPTNQKKVGLNELDVIDS